MISPKYKLYTGEFKNWEFGKVGAADLKPTKQPMFHTWAMQSVLKMRMPTTPKINFRVHLCIGISCILLLLSGCCQNKVTDCVVPVNVPEQWQTPLPCEQKTECFVADCTWWEALGDPTLNSLIEKASLQNLDLDIAALRIMQTRQERKAIEGEILPHIDASTSVGTLHFNRKLLKKALGHCVKGHSGTVSFFEAGFDADWEIDLFGVNQHKLASANAKIQASAEAYHEMWCTLSAEIARNYIELRRHQVQLQILEKRIFLQEEALKLTEELLRIGLRNTVEQKQALEQISTTKARKPFVEISIHKAIHRLSILLGEYPSELYCELSVPAGLPTLPCFKPIGIPSEVLRDRPDIRKAEQELASALEMEEVAIAEMYPRISLKAFIGDISSLCSPFSGGTAFVTPQLLFPIFNSRMLQNDVDLNKTGTRIAFLEYQKAILNAFEEVENSLTTYKSLQEQSLLLGKSIQLNEEALASMQDLYAKGFKSYFEVLSLQQAVLGSEESYLESSTQLLVEYVALYKALGGNCVKVE